MRAVRVWKLDVEYPEGSQEPGWEPEGWAIPEGFGSFDGDDLEFRWPAERLFLSRSGANQRARLLRGYGAKVTLVPSLPLEWPAGAEGQP